MQIDHVDIDLLIPDPDNANTHDEKNLKAIRGSIKQFGVVEPLVVRRQNNVVIGGNGRLTVLKQLGHTEVPVHYVDLDDQKAKALAIALNRTSELSEFNTDVLMKQLKELQNSDFDIGEIGFDAEDIQFDVPPVEGLTDPDEVPENVETRCKPGDLWILGNHRLLCGDSTNVQHVERLMGGEKADMVFTDPPYGIDVVGAGKSFGSVGAGKSFGSVGAGNVVKANKYSTIVGDDTTDTTKEFWQACQAIGLTDFVIWGGNYFTDFLPPKKCWIVWDKKGREWDDNFSDFEMAWTSYNKPAKIFTHVWMGMVQSGEREKRVHPTQKPSNLVADCLEYLKAGSVYDGFLGSGSTLIACEKTNRKCYGMEIDPHYCDVIIERWEKFTGKKATLEASNG